MEKVAFLEYVRQIEVWADAYDQERIVMSPEELEAIYDDAFFEAMELKKKLN